MYLYVWELYCFIRFCFLHNPVDEAHWFYVEIFGREGEEARATTRTFLSFDNWFMR